MPGPYTLLSVAAVVLGGVSLAGGRGGVVGPIIAVVILQLIRTDMTFLNFDTNLAIVAQGVILIGVVMSAASSSCGGAGHERRRPAPMCSARLIPTSVRRVVPRLAAHPADRPARILLVIGHRHRPTRHRQDRAGRE